MAMSNLGKTLMTHDFDTRQMLLKMHVNLMMDSAALKFKRLLKHLMMYGISKIFKYDFDWES